MSPRLPPARAPRRGLLAALAAAGAGLLSCAGVTARDAAAREAAARADEAALEAGSAAPAIDSLVIVTLDTLRADHVGCYGYFRDTTPALDAFAARSLRFTRCAAPIAHTTPSHASLFTSVHPFEHGITSNAVQQSDQRQRAAALRTAPTLRTLAQVLAAQGLATGGFVSAAPVKAVTGLAQGFAVWSEPEQHRRAGNETVAAALAWLDGLGDAPFFLFVHLFDAHGPFDADHPPPEYRDRFRRDDALERWLAERRFPRQVSGVHVDDANPVDVVNTYDGAVRLLDDRLAPLLERLGRPELAARAIVAVTADHGQGLGQHDFVGHGVVWREQLDVPLLLCAPGLPPGVNESLAATIDVVPTLLGLAPALADDAFRRQCQGSDLLVAGVEPRPHFGMAPARRGLLSYATTRWRLHVRPDGAPLLFDLEADPFELEDVAAREPEIVERMHKALAAEVARQRRREEIHAAGSASGATAPDPKHLEELEKLGYATDGDERE